MHVEMVHVAAVPVERAFATIADITRRPSWVGIARERIPLSGEAPTAGARYRAVDRLPGRTVEYIQTIDRLEPNHLLEESWGGPMRGRSSIRFTDEGSATRLTIEADVASPLPSRLSLLEPLARRVAKRKFRQDLDRLDRLLS